MRALVLATLCLAGLTLVAQNRPATGIAPAFDVVSIKRNTSGDNRGDMGYRPGGRYVAVNTPVHLFIGLAYPVQGSQIVGAPDWFYSDPYDINARMLGDPDPAQREALWRSLFAERMKLQAHIETREQDVYALAVARADGRASASLKQVDMDCDAPGAPPQCTSMGRTGVATQGMSMPALARLIQPTTGRIVVDRTRLSGTYAFSLTFSPTRPNAPVDPARPGNDLPSIFTALPEQLGLKLESTRAPVEVLVIDHIERPTED